MTTLAKICLIFLLTGILVFWFAPFLSKDKAIMPGDVLATVINPHQLEFFVFYGKMLSILGAGIFGLRFALRKIEE